MVCELSGRESCMAVEIMMRFMETTKSEYKISDTNIRENAAHTYCTCANAC